MEDFNPLFEEFGIRLALFEPEIPQNTGNIGRLCVGTGRPLIIVGKPGFLLRQKEVRRAGLDYWDRLKLKRYAGLEEFEKAHENARIVPVSKYGQTPYYDFEFSKDDMLVFGKESIGLPKPFLEKHKKKSVFIPMTDKIRSLNISNSVAILLYEAFRQHVMKRA